MAYIAYGLYSYGLYSHGLYSHGLYSHGLYCHGLCSHGLYSCGLYSYGLYSHGLCRYGDIGDDEKAAAFLRQSYEGLVRSPFYVWHEGFNEFGGAPNFINGAGMFLVNIAAGYGGVRWNLTDGSLDLKRPRPPPNCTKLVLRRVYFRGARLNVEAREDTWFVALIVV